MARGRPPRAIAERHRQGLVALQANVRSRLLGGGYLVGSRDQALAIVSVAQPDFTPGLRVNRQGRFLRSYIHVLSECPPPRWCPGPGTWAVTPNRAPLSHHPTLALVSLQADLNTNMEDEGSSFYGVSSQYESPENMIITCSTKVCSFGKQVVEKVEVGHAAHLGSGPSRTHTHTPSAPSWASHLFPQICLN